MKLFGVLGWPKRRFYLKSLFLGLMMFGSTGSLLASQVTLAWDAANDPTVMGYNVFFGGATRVYTNVVDAGNATSVTISNLVPGGTYYFAATTYNLAGLESDYSLEASYAVPMSTNAPNPQPTLDPIGNVVMNENGGVQTVDLTGISSGAANQTLTLTVTAFSSVPSIVPNPTVNYSSPNSAGTLTFTPMPNISGTAVITVMVDNGGTVSNTVIRSFTVTVNSLNHPPTLDPLGAMVLAENSGSQTVNLTGISTGATNEIQTLTITAASDNPSLIPNPTVSYTSPNATGRLSFAPITNAFGTAQIAVTVNDGQTNNNITTRSFSVTVNQTAPITGTLTNAYIAPSTAFRFQLLSPYGNGDKLSYALGAGAPAGVKVTTHRGASYLTWTPTTAQALTTNLITIVLTDTTNPTLNTNETMLITVLDYLALTVGDTSVPAGQSAMVPIYLSCSSGVTNLSFTMDWPTTRFLNPTLFISVPGIANSSVQTQSTNLLISLQTAAGIILQKSNLVAQLSFQTVSNQSSAFVNLAVRNLSAAKPDSTPYVNYIPGAGEVAVVSTKPLLASGLDINANRTLTAFGNVGTIYQIQSSTSPAVLNSWKPVASYTQTNISQSLPVDPNNPQIYYRLLVQ